MSELTEIRDSLTRLDQRLKREENYQAGVRRLPCTCNCHKVLSEMDPDLGRLQDYLADIRREMGITEANQEGTMERLKAVLRGNVYDLSKLRNVVGCSSLTGFDGIVREVQALMKRSGTRATMIHDARKALDRNV